MNRLFAIAAVFLVFLTLGIASADAQSGARPPQRENVGDEIPTIFDVRKSLPMEPTDPTYHDFYINAGVEAGFKKGQYLPVQRAIPVHDPVQNKQQAILTVPVGKILVIHVERNMTVARLATELADDERPTLEYEAIMIGDRIDMKGISTVPPKDIGRKKRKVAAVEVSPEPAPAQLAPAVADGPAASVTVQGAELPAASGATQPAPLKSDSASQPSSPPRVTQRVPPPTA